MAWEGVLGQSKFGLIPLRKESQTGCVPVYKIVVSDGPDLALCKESRKGNRSQAFDGRSRIMIRPSKESPSTAATTEHERTERGMSMDGPIGCQQRIQILRG